MTRCHQIRYSLISIRFRDKFELIKISVQIRTTLYFYRLLLITMYSSEIIETHSCIAGENDVKKINLKGENFNAFCNGFNSPANPAGRIWNAKHMFISIVSNCQWMIWYRNVMYRLLDFTTLLFHICKSIISQQYVRSVYCLEIVYSAQCSDIQR